LFWRGYALFISSHIFNRIKECAEKCRHECFLWLSKKCGAPALNTRDSYGCVITSCVIDLFCAKQEFKEGLADS